MRENINVYMRACVLCYPANINPYFSGDLTNLRGKELHLVGRRHEYGIDVPGWLSCEQTLMLLCVLACYAIQLYMNSYLKQV